MFFMPMSFLFLTLQEVSLGLSVQVGYCGYGMHTTAHPNPVSTGQFFCVSTQHSSGNSMPVAFSFLDFEPACGKWLIAA